MVDSEFIKKLALWDGIHVEYLIDMYRAKGSGLDFFEALVTICVQEQDLQKATTWLIKYHYDQGNSLPEVLVEKLISCCLTFENWEAKLHLLQLLPHVTLSEKSIPLVHDFVNTCLTDHNKFVRAWAYNGLYEISKYIPEMKPKVAQICQKALQVESAAIQSKAKKILSALDKQNSVK